MRGTQKLLVATPLLWAALCFGAPRQHTIVAGSHFRVEIVQRTRMQAGQTVRSRVVDPVYADNHLLIPRGALLEGRIETVQPASRQSRTNARFHGDFTPLGEPAIRWTMLLSGDGDNIPLSAASSGKARSVLYHGAVEAPRTSLMQRLLNSLASRPSASAEYSFRANRLEMLQRYFWSQMPMHPQYVEPGSQYEITLGEALELPSEPSPAQVSIGAPHSLEHMASVRTRLRTSIDSAHAKVGDPVEAIVVEPVLDDREQLLIPQDSILIGTVTRAVPSRRWGHNGILQFSFTELRWPTGFRQKIEAVPTAIEGSPDIHVQIDRKGGMAPEHMSASMGAFSTPSMGDEAGPGRTVSAPGDCLSLVTHALVLGTGAHYIGDTLGAVGNARDAYRRFLGQGRDVSFNSDTEVQLEISPATNSATARAR